MYVYILNNEYAYYLPGETFNEAVFKIYKYILYVDTEKHLTISTILLTPYLFICLTGHMVEKENNCGMLQSTFSREKNCSNKNNTVCSLSIYKRKNSNKFGSA